MAACGVALGVAVVRDRKGEVDMPASAFAWLSVLASAGWGVGFVVALLL